MSLPKIGDGDLILVYNLLDTSSYLKALVLINLKSNMKIGII